MNESVSEMCVQLCQWVCKGKRVQLCLRVFPQNVQKENFSSGMSKTEKTMCESVSVVCDKRFTQRRANSASLLYETPKIISRMTALFYSLVYGSVSVLCV